MKVIDKEDEEIYSLFMDKIATAVLVESHKGMKEQKDRPVENYSVELGMAVGQIVLDKVIDLTKDMNKDFLTKLLTELAIAHCIDVMEKHPEYKLRIAILNNMI